MRVVVLAVLYAVALTSCAPVLVMVPVEPTPFHSASDPWWHVVSLHVNDKAPVYFPLGTGGLTIQNRSKAVRESFAHHLMRYHVNIMDHTSDDVQVNVKGFRLTLNGEMYDCELELAVMVRRDNQKLYSEETMGVGSALNVVDLSYEKAVYAALDQALQQLHFDNLVQTLDKYPEGYAPLPPAQDPQLQDILRENRELEHMHLRLLRTDLSNDPLQRDMVFQENALIMQDNERICHERAERKDHMAEQWIVVHQRANPAIRPRHDHEHDRDHDVHHASQQMPQPTAAPPAKAPAQVGPTKSEQHKLDSLKATRRSF